MAFFREARDAVFAGRVVDDVRAVGIGEGEVDVQTRSASVAEGLAHEGEQQSHSTRDLSSQDLEQESVVGRAKCVTVPQRELELWRVVFGVH